MSLLQGLRAFLFEKEIFPATDLPAFTISVGNISMGGTGKSPFVSLLARELLAKNISTVLLSRGYGREEKKPVFLRSESLLPSPKKIGDEPWMIREANPGLALVVHPNRAALAKKHWQDIGCPQAVLLDDAFQHWRAKRDLDVVMLDATESLSQNALPFGRLRETVAALSRADLVVLTRADEVSAATLKNIHALVKERFQKRRRRAWQREKIHFEPLVLDAKYVFSAFKDVRSKKEISPQKLKDIFLLTGIAKPKGFLRLLNSLGLAPKESVFLPDHGALNDAIKEKIRLFRQKYPAGYVVVTQKDWARWQDFFQGNETPALFAEVSLQFAEEHTLRSWLDRVFACIT